MPGVAAYAIIYSNLLQYLIVLRLLNILLFVIVHLVIPVIVTGQTDSFRRYSVPDNMSVLDYMTVESTLSQSVEGCLVKCVNDEECQGVVYDEYKRCYLQKCANPQLLTNRTELISDNFFYISERVNLQHDKLLARGE